MLPSPASPQTSKHGQRVEQSRGTVSVAVQPQNKGAAHWLSYLLCIGILCWDSRPPSAGVHKKNGWATLPQAKEELPKPVLGALGTLKERERRGRTRGEARVQGTAAPRPPAQGLDTD